MTSAVNGRSSPVSQVLFLSETGEPMRFFLRPGPTKAQLQPIIKAGGGVVTSAQMPNNILLVDPEDIAGVPPSTMHWYISTQYIRDCVEKNQQLEVEDYRFSSQSVQTRSEKRRREATGRVGYTAEDDAAILRFVSSRTHEVRGNRLWQQMERQGVTSHSWQSMKDRYRKHLVHQQPAEDRGKEPSVGLKEQSPKKDCPQPCPEKDPVQVSLDKTHPETSPEKRDAMSLPETVRPQPSPESAQPQSSPDKTHACPSPEQMLPQVSPQGIQGQPSPEQRLPQSSPDRSHPQVLAEKTRPQEQVCPQGPPEITDVPPVEKVHPQLSPETVQQQSLARGGNSVGKESAGPSSMPILRNEQMMGVDEEEEDEPISAPKRRKLGIFESAMKEFEESDEADDETPDIPLSSTTSTDPRALGNGIPISTSAQVTQPSKNSEAQPELQPESPKVQQGAPVNSTGTEDSVPAQRSAPSASNVHMFLFERESQEEESSQPAGDAPFSQAQLEEAKQHLRDLMRESKQGLVSVTKSLLKNSGDVPASLHYLLTGQKLGAQGPFWDQRDDSLLMSADPSQHKLHEKYGEVAVAKRIAFLDIE